MKNIRRLPEDNQQKILAWMGHTADKLPEGREQREAFIGYMKWRCRRECIYIVPCNRPALSPIGFNPDTATGNIRLAASSPHMLPAIGQWTSKQSQ